MSNDFADVDYADIRLRFGPQRPVPNLPNQSCVTFEIQGRNRTVSIFLPATCIPSHITLESCDRWIAAIQGSLVSGCGVDDEQRELLLHIFLAYRAFVRALPGMKHDDWFRFSSTLIVAASAASRGERVDDQLSQLVEWLHSELPVSTFLEGDYPPITYNDDPPPLEPQHVVLAPDAISLAEQQALRQHHEDIVTSVVLRAMRSLPQGAEPDNFPVALIAFAQEDDARRAAGMPPLPTPPEPTDDEIDDDASQGSLYLTVGLPSFIIGSFRTPVTEILAQCTFYKVARDGSTQRLFNPLTFPIMLLAGPPPAPSTPPTQPSTPPTVPATPTHDLTPTHGPTTSTPSANGPAARADPTTSRQVLSTLGGISPLATSSPVRTSARGRRSASRTARATPSSGGAHSASSSRRRQSVADIEAMNARQRAEAEARRRSSQEARNARAAARAARHMTAHTEGENVTDSDDSMPSLRTITDSSDGVVSDLDLAYPDEE